MKEKIDLTPAQEIEIRMAYEKSGWWFNPKSQGCRKFRLGYIAAKGWNAR